MLHFLIATHGPLASALVSSAKMVFGELQNTSCVSLTEEGGIEQFKQDFNTEIRDIAGQVEGIVVLCDLECGTPYNIACTYAFDGSFPVPVEVVTGINFPTLLMTADFVEESDPASVAQTLQQEALNTIVVAKLVSVDQDDDF